MAETRFHQVQINSFRLWEILPWAVAESGFFGMLKFGITEWIPVETYGGISLASHDEFLSKDLCNRSLLENLAPPENF